MFEQIIPAFVVGGLICVVGQLLMDLTKPTFTPAHVLVTFVTGGAVLGALGVYEPLVKFAGAGASVPLSGFGYSLAKGAIEAVGEKGLIGAFSGGVEATAVGIAAAVFFGYLVSVTFNPKG
ncbi:stage V sporulation protein AE [Desulfitobacterium sp. LBE]|uniref:Stage V sporulation protein AE n=5 Tax=root TaxID=1 RepID=Q24V54_DESHY|nr:MULTISPECIES: stage V sporulation protein AE [Desulfitobacterium]ACL21455.1 stage V sporulation protein AE [Desulfitobacterium hafniense DCB-2]EHL07644.1 stage V sporulation protein AE [Desulfitobacterium hafniense DP7]KTE89870.1 stage V sporulation protein AEB [Desulfitobacterium hafniense]MEA5023146.1 stage V sporulation protein AE [Desulfitobacterium hafniense]TWH60757.1 stage V sporulation protein AE [Desulfitobacterium sp. LBE]